MMRLPELPPEFRPAAAPPCHLAVILSELHEMGIRPTALAVLCRAGDLGLDDEAMAALVDKLAGIEGIEGARHA